MRIERNIGADVIMQFDHVIPGQSERRGRQRRKRAKCSLAGALSAEFESLDALDNAARRIRQALFPIVQGGIHADLRREAAHRHRAA